MPLRSAQILRERAAAGVEVCRTHGPSCKKYPDHPAVQERARRHWEMSKDLTAMAWTGHLLGQMKELADAGYEVPEEFTRGNEDPPQGERVRLFFERYDLAKHFPSEEPERSNECKTRKLSDDELRQRKEWAAEVKAARLKKGIAEPAPPWEGFTSEELAELRKALGQGVEDQDEPNRERARREREAEKAALVQRLKADEELARKMSEALATWVNLPPRNSRHTQDVREGYGDAVPEFEE